MSLTDFLEGQSIGALTVSAWGLFISAFISALAYQRRQSDEELRIVRKVLFNLLSLWDIARITAGPDRSAMNEFFKIFIDEVRRLLGSQAAESMESEKDHMIKKLIPLVQRAAVLTRGSMDEGTRSSYRSSIDTLAERRPLLAFGLNGMENLQSIFDALDSYERDTDQLLESLQSTQLKSHVDAGRIRVRTYIDDDLRQSLKDSILIIARSISIRTWWQCRRIIRHAEAQPMFGRSEKKKLRDMFSALLSEALENSKRFPEVSEEKPPASM